MSAKVFRVYNLACDRQGCDEWSPDFVPYGRSSTKLRDARTAARREGWAFIGGKDYCPKHSPRRGTTEQEQQQ